MINRKLRQLTAPVTHIQSLSARHRRQARSRTAPLRFYSLMAPETPVGLPSERWSDSFWHSEPSTKLFGHRSTADLPKQADVVIVGSGITAAGAAWKLLRGLPETSSGHGRPLSVVMLEAREACWGATGRNGGHCFPIVYDYPQDPSIGHFELANLRAIDALVHGLDIDCEYHPQSSVRAIYSNTDLEEAKRALAVLKENDPSLAAFTRLVTNPAELSRLRVPSAIGATTSNAAARLWVYKFVARLLEELIFPPTPARQHWSLNLQTSTPVVSLCRAGQADSQNPTAWALATPRGVIQASRVILATNGHTSALLPEFSDLVVPCRGQVAALLPPSEATGRERINNNYIFTGPGFYDYLIQRPDAQGGHLIFGGGSEARGLGFTDDSILDAETTAYLRRRLHDHLGLPKASGSTESELEPSHQWTGIMGYSRDGIPWVGAVPSRPGVFIAAGYTGNGMPNAFLSGQAVAAMVNSDIKYRNRESALQAATQDPKIGLPRAYLVSQERIERARELEVPQW